ncbi:hypothetical protein J5N97_029021 [Dioscorea zingiberensis]|uniref:Uncharacterized protein n=1 Tax=Dioscorea zingiberensis TaxID=325984 RepID=A0A9D5C0A1_9LILI|nr:hypothetical protein J5N97_029021 [Dioscorea zingiberensis]
MTPYSVLVVILSLSLFLIDAGARPGVQFHPCSTSLVVSYSTLSSSSSDGEPSRIFSVDRIITSLGDYSSPDTSSMDIVRWISIERLRTVYLYPPPLLFAVFLMMTLTVMWHMWSSAAAIWEAFIYDKGEENRKKFGYVKITKGTGN